MNARLRWSLISAAAVATGAAAFVSPEERKPIELAAAHERPAQIIPAAMRQQSTFVAEWALVMRAMGRDARAGGAIAAGRTTRRALRLKNWRLS